MDGRITTGLDPGASHDGVVLAVEVEEEQGEPGAARPPRHART